MFLIYGGVDEELGVRCHTDASFQTDQDDSRSQSGYVFTLNGGAGKFQTEGDCTIYNRIRIHCYI